MYKISNNSIQSAEADNVYSENEYIEQPAENFSSSGETFSEDLPGEELSTDELFDEDSSEEATNEASDLETLKDKFSELRSVNDISLLPNATRYGELRALGLTAEEAYLASRGRRVSDSRAHLADSFPRGAKAPASPMTRRELHEARELFGDLDDSQIIKLYRKVTR